MGSRFSSRRPDGVRVWGKSGEEGGRGGIREGGIGIGLGGEED